MGWISQSQLVLIGGESLLALHPRMQPGISALSRTQVHFGTYVFNCQRRLLTYSGCDRQFVRIQN